MGDGEHFLTVPFRGCPRSSVVAAALLAAATKGLLREQTTQPKPYNLYATGLPHIVHHLPALSIALVQSPNLTPTLSTCSRIQKNLRLTVKGVPVPTAER